MTDKPLSLFEGYGIEIESVVVDKETLEVRPVVDQLLREAGGLGEWIEDYDDGAIGWSNELVAHVVELKTNGPAPTFDGLVADFRASAGRADALLKRTSQARLMPTGMHPWMDPRVETKLWPHESGPVYREYHRLFDCFRHGWANVQSVHLNLPFADETEFARLMAASRLVLPLIPALAASSPIVEGRVTGLLDNRLEFYRTNAQRVPAMAGEVIPEPVYGIAEYRDKILAAVDRGLGEIDADEILRGREWTNARGAIARFDRNAIEIRLIDAQECAAADLAVAALVSAVVRALVEERWASFERQCAVPSRALVDLLAASVRDGPRVEAVPAEIGSLFGVEAGKCATLGRVWESLAESTFDGPSELEPALQVILREGVLAERILTALGPAFDRSRLRAVYAELCECLASGRSFTS